MNNYNKQLYKIELYFLKVIPMVISGLYLGNIILSYFNIDVKICSILGGMSVLPLIFIYISSIVFKFCNYHRMFIHYIGTCNLIEYLDYYECIPLSDRAFLIMSTIITGIFLFIILYLKNKI